jgi:DNA-binding response OmpR family regulator
MMRNTAEHRVFSAERFAAPTEPSSPEPVPTGIEPFDERRGGLSAGGSYLVVGTPGPAKMVAALQFLRTGVEAGEAGVLVTNADAAGILGIARAWGLDLDHAWRDGGLRIVGFRDDFELRAVRSVEPGEVVEELALLVGGEVSRLAVDPGSLFLGSGARSLLASSFLTWARQHPATVCTTFSVDGWAAGLPSSADWLLHATTGRLVIDARTHELYEITLIHAAPGPSDTEGAVSVQLKPGGGLILPESFPARRGRDRPGVDENRLLLISLGGDHTDDVATWAQSAFAADIVCEPLEAVARAQSDPSFGGVLVHAPRHRVREAVQACRALRPLTRAAIVFASDDAVRSSDRIQILEAGADDCLSGGIDFRELALRIRQAVAAGARPLLHATGQGAEPSSVQPRAVNGRVELQRLKEEIARRAAHPVQKFFCVLDVTSGAIEPARLEELLVQQVRVDDGDLVASVGGRCAVLLQGAREAQLGPFLERLGQRLQEAASGTGSDRAADVLVLSHPADADRIQALIGNPSVDAD